MREEKRKGGGRRGRLSMSGVNGGSTDWIRERGGVTTSGVQGRNTHTKRREKQKGVLWRRTLTRCALKHKYVAGQRNHGGSGKNRDEDVEAVECREEGGGNSERGRKARSEKDGRLRGDVGRGELGVGRTMLETSREKRDAARHKMQDA